MKPEDKGKSFQFSMVLFPRDLARFKRVVTWLEELHGRPMSKSKALIYLLDCFDEARKIDDIIKAQAEKEEKFHAKKRKTGKS